MNKYMQSQSNNQLTGKLIVLAILVAITWIATMFVWGVVLDRESRQTQASYEISEQWSRPQTVAGPVITVPVEKTSVTTTGERVVNTVTLTLLPQDLSFESEIETQILKRGIYNTPVYTTTVKGAGSFDLGDVEQGAMVDTRVLWDQAVVSIHVSDPRGIASTFDITFNGEQYEMLPSSEFAALDGSGVHAEVPVDSEQAEHQFSFEFPLKGSQEMLFLPLGENTEVAIRSSWSAPSFVGEFLPESRDVTEEGFSAVWNIAAYGKNLPQSWVSMSAIDRDKLHSKAFGVSLFQEVDFYTMVNRSVKYSILFISLTFLTFFMYEVLVGLRIHPMQYLLVGLAIALFYLLLLSFAEIVGFLSAYLVAAVATTALITGYCFSVLKAKKRAFSITTLLAALYTYLYILLQLDQYSLLFGSVLLFGVLATVMYITRNLDWYTLNTKE